MVDSCLHCKFRNGAWRPCAAFQDRVLSFEDRIIYIDHGTYYMHWSNQTIQYHATYYMHWSNQTIKYHVTYCMHWSNQTNGEAEFSEAYSKWGRMMALYAVPLMFWWHIWRFLLHKFNRLVAFFSYFICVFIEWKSIVKNNTKVFVCLQGVWKLSLVGQLSRSLPLFFVFLAEL